MWGISPDPARGILPDSTAISGTVLRYINTVRSHADQLRIHVCYIFTYHVSNWPGTAMDLHHHGGVSVYCEVATPTTMHWVCWMLNLGFF